MVIKMALIVEDGSIVQGANSYVNLADARAIAEQLAVILPADDTEAEKVLIQATWYIDEKCYKGELTDTDQSIVFPRTGMYVKGFEFPSNEIPTDIKRAQVAAAAGYYEGANTRTINDGKSIKKEKLDTLEVEYFDNGKTSSGSVITFAEQFLKHYKCSTSKVFKTICRI